MRLLYPDHLYVSVKFLEPDEVRRRYDAEAIFLARPLVYENGDRLKTRKLGTVVFGKDSYGGGMVAHELLHATLHWATAVRLDGIADNHEAEERLCTQLGMVVSQFWNAHYEQEKNCSTA